MTDMSERPADRIPRDLALARAGRWRVVTIDGEPGIGKTRLLDQLAERAAAEGFAVHRGQATEFERDLPFGPYVEALESLADLVDPASEQRAALDALLGGGGLERHQVHRGIRQLLGRYAADRPVALLLDDLHWADAASVELTEYLLRRPPGGALLIALAYRTAGMPPRLADAVAHLGTAVTRLHVGPLRPDEVAGLAPGAGSRRRRLLHRASGGNPLYLQALLEVSDQGLAELVGGPGAPVAPPGEGLVALLRAELDALEPGLRTVLHAAAIAGDEVPLGLVAAVAGEDEATVADALDRLAWQGVVRQVGARFRFRHPLLRAAAYWTAGSGWQGRAHARAAAYLRACDGPLALLAHHTERSARYGDERAAGVLSDAATVAAVTAPSSAAQLLRTAVQILPDRPDLLGDRLAMQMTLARALGVTGALAESRELLNEVVRVPGPHRGPAIAFSSVLSRLVGDFDRARALLADELDRVPRGPAERLTAQLLTELAAVELLRGVPAGARDCAARAAEAAAGTGDTALEAAGYALLALGHLHLGEVDPARAGAARAAGLLDAASDDVLSQHVEVVAPLAWVEAELGDAERAGRQLARGIRLANRAGLSHALPYLLVVDASRQAASGRLADATGAAEEAYDVAMSMQSPETAAMARVALLRPALWRHGGRVALEVAETLTGQGLPRSTWWARLAALRLAEVYLHAGRTDAALRQLEAAGDGPERLAMQAQALGGTEEARRLAERALDMAHLPQVRAAAQYALARVLLRQGREAAAIGPAVEAAAGYAAVGQPVPEGYARELLAELRSRTGDLAAARTELGLAKELAAGCGAGGLAARLPRLDARLAARASRPDRPTAGLSTLTDREREVAELAGGGLTNREIAQRLHVSQKTVEAHLSRVFAKLDVTSRVGLTRRLVGG